MPFFIFSRQCRFLLLFLFLHPGNKGVLGADANLTEKSQALRRELGWPAFDSLLRLNPVHRCLFMDRAMVQPIVDKAAFRQLVADFRKYADENQNHDGELLADILAYAAFCRDYSFLTQARRHFDYLERLHRKSSKYGVHWFDVEIKLFLSRAYLVDIRNYESGLLLLRELAATADDRNFNSSPRNQQILMQLGLAYISFNDMKNALYYFRKALNAKVHPEMKDRRRLVLLQNNLGLCFRDLRQLDSSDYYFRKELLLTKILQDSIYEHITMGNLGENQYLRGNYDAALPLLEADDRMARKIGDFQLSANALILMGDIYTRKGNYKKADSLLTKGLQLTRLTESYRRKKKAFPILARYYIKTGQPELAALYLDSSQFVADSLVRLNNQSKVSVAEADFAYQNLKIQAGAEAADLRFTRFLLAAGLIILLLISLLGFLYFIRFRPLVKLRMLDLQTGHSSPEPNPEEVS